MFRKIYRIKIDPLILQFHRSSSTTIDASEESHFKKQSLNWWDKTGEMKPLHSMNRIRVPFIRDGLINTGIVKKEFVDTPAPLTSLSILDVGCGGGILSEAIARLGATVIGLDPTKELIEIARCHASSQRNLNNLQYVEDTVSNHASSFAEKYDAVVLSEVIEHVSKKEPFLEACVQCLKPGGSIFITTISKTTASWIGAIIIGEQIAKFLPVGTHQWEKFIQPHQLQRLLEQNNCRTRLIHGLFYNILANTWHWSSFTSINYALHAIKDCENINEN